MDDNQMEAHLRDYELRLRAKMMRYGRDVRDETVRSAFAKVVLGVNKELLRLRRVNGGPPPRAHGPKMKRDGTFEDTKLEAEYVGYTTGDWDSDGVAGSFQASHPDTRETYWDRRMAMYIRDVVS